MTESQESEASPLPGRECGTCHMCCKVFPIEEIGKEGFADCANLNVGAGCTIYETRPQRCRSFFCHWRLEPSLDESWKPEVCGFVLHDPVPFAMLASVDPDRPDSWRQEPYYSQLRAWARDLAEGQHLAGVRIGEKTLLLLKDREVEINV
jgi:Fe-S-cluster containining protein